jgi:drug/metabolite transporter (DMT)-like permease
MIYLLVTSLLWAFSFGLIKGNLAGLPAPAVAALRLLIALAVFAPFLRIRILRTADILRLLLTGAVQYGLMYTAYMHAFRYLQAHEVALFTVFTPIYITLLNDLAARRFRPRTLAAILLAVAGGFLIEYRQLESTDWWRGFALMQGANLCFAFGQIFYRRTMERLPQQPSDLHVFGLLYLGGALTAGLAAAGTAWSGLSVTPMQAGTLLYLGVIASGLGFFLWNSGARRVSTGTLAVFNNLKIPLGILVAVTVFGEATDLSRLLGGGGLMILALLLNRRAS